MDEQTKDRREQYPSEYGSWKALRSRCADRNNPNYGGRGIRCCPRWDSFEIFIQDMGPKPSADHSIDRINVDGDYEPRNCRWATAAEQARNTRRTIFLVFENRRMCLEDWAQEMSLEWTTLYSRLRSYGWPLEKALTTPERNVGNRSSHGSPRRKKKIWEIAHDRLATIAGEEHLPDHVVRTVAVDAGVWCEDLGSWLVHGRFRRFSRRWMEFTELEVSRILAAIARLEAGEISLMPSSLQKWEAAHAAAA